MLLECFSLQAQCISGETRQSADGFSRFYVWVPQVSFLRPGRPRTSGRASAARLDGQTTTAGFCLDGQSLQIITFLWRTMISEVFLQIIVPACPLRVACQPEAANRGQNCP